MRIVTLLSSQRIYLSNRSEEIELLEETALRYLDKDIINSVGEFVLERIVAIFLF
jgi:hypothetical protein